MDNTESAVIEEDKIKANDIWLHLKVWKQSKENCEEFFRNKKIMHLSEYISKYDDHIKNKKDKEEIIILCTVVNIPYQTRKYNQEKYIFWDVSDLKETQSRLFLTGEICEKNENEKEGIVVALVNPFIKDKDPQYYNSRILEVHDSNNLKVIGSVDHLEKCKGRKRNGEGCKIILYTPLSGNYCKYHIKQDRKKKGKKRTMNSAYGKDEHSNANVNEDLTYDIVTNLGEEAENSSITTNMMDNDKESRAKKKAKKEGSKNKGGEEVAGESAGHNEETFDVESIIGMYTKKLVVKDKKKKMELINDRIKELDNYSKLNNEAINIDILKNKDTITKEENPTTTQRSINDIFSEQCPELMHLIYKSNKKKEEENDINKKDSIKVKEVNSSTQTNVITASNEKKQKKKFESFLNKLNELKKSRDENDVKTLLNGLTHVTNNFHFSLNHINNSNIFDICYKLMDHRSEEIAIAALKFKRRINKLYIDYYKNRQKYKNDAEFVNVSSCNMHEAQDEVTKE
ncbi:hypothetical protein MKS88_004359 [Plasmodium brasilianum]|uniref:Uncharacterized protein n=1 Tax=Plasmodium brasilianum TaxID=5824 RepID=A0ACB9Y617_PLABR|nr:hypothetical protein MKS88_004359 [Plasmodium brasilianum]